MTRETSLASLDEAITELRTSIKNVTDAEVRKELRARYPKHSWPEDPLTAAPQAKGGRRT